MNEDDVGTFSECERVLGVVGDLGDDGAAVAFVQVVGHVTGGD